MEIEVTPKRKPETYHRDAQTELSGSKMKLGKIAEEEDDESEEDRFGALVNKQPDATRRRSSRVVTTGIVPGREDGERRPRLSMKEERNINGEDIKELSKQEAKEIMKTSEFQGFLERSSRFIERALNQEFDLHGNFFEEF